LPEVVLFKRITEPLKTMSRRPSGLQCLAIVQRSVFLPLNRDLSVPLDGSPLCIHWVVVADLIATQHSMGCGFGDL